MVTCRVCVEVTATDVYRQNQVCPGWVVAVPDKSTQFDPTPMFWVPMADLPPSDIPKFPNYCLLKPIFPLGFPGPRRAALFGCVSSPSPHRLLHGSHALCPAPLRRGILLPFSHHDGSPLPPFSFPSPGILKVPPVCPAHP